MSEHDSTQTEYGPNYIGNVIRILDKRTLIVNVGSSKLDIGDDIKVYIPVEPLYNLDGSILCMYEHTKDTLEVIDVAEKYSVCRKMEQKIVEPSGFASVTSVLAISPIFNEKKEYIPLKVDNADITPIKDFNPNIQIGDPIKRA